MMKRLFLKIGTGMITIYLIISLSFFMVRFMPGDPLLHLVGHEQYYYLKEFEPQELDRIAVKYKISGTLLEQYAEYLKNIVSLDFGIAYENKQPVLNNILSAAKWTLVITLPALIIGAFFGAVLGVVAGWKVGGMFDRIVTPLFLFLNTIPTNCIGVLFLILFAFRLGWFPINGMTSGGLKGLDFLIDVARHAALPAMILVLFRTSSNFMLMKSNVSQIKNEDYILTARSKGLSDQRVLFRHILKNAMLPYVSSLCIQIGFLFSGSMLLEVIFGWRGMGQLYFNAVSKRDFPTAQACFILTAVCVVFANFLGDVINEAIDPRLKEDPYEK